MLKSLLWLSPVYLHSASSKHVVKIASKRRLVANHVTSNRHRRRPDATLDRCCNRHLLENEDYLLSFTSAPPLHRCQLQPKWGEHFAMKMTRSGFISGRISIGSSVVFGRKRTPSCLDLRRPPPALSMPLRHSTTPCFKLLYSKRTTKTLDEGSDSVPFDLASMIPRQIYPGITVYDALQKSLQLLANSNIPEPEESALHLLSNALETNNYLSWEDGYRKLRMVLALDDSLITSLAAPNTEKITTAGSVETTETAGTKITQRSSLTQTGAANTNPIIQLAEKMLTKEETQIFQANLRKRMSYEPIQYIVGKWDFHHLIGLRIKAPMLCPRPETEELVELVLNEIESIFERKKTEIAIKKDKGEGIETKDAVTTIRVLDVGCGTGAIGIAIARHAYLQQQQQQQQQYNVQVVALDVLQEAVDLANENANMLLFGSCFSFPDGDGASSRKKMNASENKLYNALLRSANEFTNRSTTPTNHYESATTSSDVNINNEHQYIIGGQQCNHEMNFDIVVSNPPYIPSQDMKGLSHDVVAFESHLALCGGEDGLDVIRDIVDRLPEWMSSDIGNTGYDTKTKSTDDDLAITDHHDCKCPISSSIDKNNKCCWMEVDESHPTMIAKWLAPGSTESKRLRVEFCEYRKDFCGRDRFVKLKVI